VDVPDIRMRAPLHEMNDVAAACNLGFFPYIAFPAPHFDVPEPSLPEPAEPDAAENSWADEAPLIEIFADAPHEGALLAEREAIAPVEMNLALAGPAMVDATRAPAALPPAPPLGVRVARIPPPAHEARPTDGMANAALLREVFQPSASTPAATPPPPVALGLEPAPHAWLADPAAPFVAGAAHRRTNHVGEFALLAELSGLSIPVPPAQSGGISVARTGLAPIVPPNPPERRPARSVASQVLAIARVAGTKDQ